jgi:hypothetical protein
MRQPTEHPTEHEDPQDFLDRAHPENDQYMKGVEHIQRQMMATSNLLRPKQVNILKTLFTGENYTETAKRHHTTGQTVSRLAKSPNGSRLLSLLSYHLKMIEGPNEAQRRGLLWRIAIDNEKQRPNTSIAAVESINKMQFQEKQIESGTTGNVVQIIINPEHFPRGALDG